MRFSIPVFFFCATSLSGCGGAHFEVENLDQAMMTEAVCVVAAESFGLYKAAERHRKHGNDWGSYRAEIEGKNNDFHLFVRQARLKAGQLGQKGAATFLTTMCDETLTNEKFDKYSGS